METCFLSKEVELKNVNETGLQVHCTSALDSALPSNLSLGSGDGALLEGVGDVGLPGVSKRAVGQRLPSRHRVGVGLHRGGTGGRSSTGGGTGSEAGGGRGTRGHLRWFKGCFKFVGALLVATSARKWGASSAPTKLDHASAKFVAKGFIQLVYYFGPCVATF